jgi:hypothetical protein
MTNVDELAVEFWERVGPPPRFPRDLEVSVLLGLALAIVKLPRLRATSVDAWFAERGRPHVVGGPDRVLRGCLFAVAGRGVVFVDAADPPDEQRYSLAHEVAHFLGDYLVPREKILARMGPEAADILDGRRRPSPSERIDGLLAGATLGVHRHLMDRVPQSEARVGRSESRADRLALELLAPRDVVIRSLRGMGRRTEAAVRRVLADDFGLPAAVAQSYAATFTPQRAAVVRLRRWLDPDVEVPARPRNTRRDS